MVDLSSLTLSPYVPSFTPTYGQFGYALPTPEREARHGHHGRHTNVVIQKRFDDPRVTEAYLGQPPQEPHHVTPTMGDLTLEEYGRHERLNRLRNKYTKVDIPFSLLTAGASYLAYMQFNADVRALNDISRWVDARRQAITALNTFLTNSQLSVGTSQEAYNAVPKLGAALSRGEAPAIIRELYGRMVSQVSINPYTSVVGRSIVDYDNAHRAIMGNSEGLAKMTVPVMSRLLGLPVEQAKRLARTSPYDYLKRLMAEGLKNPALEQQVLPNVLSELRKAKRLMGGVIAGTVAFTLIGFFMERAELNAKRTQEWS
jgi:hypothetical protein